MDDALAAWISTAPAGNIKTVMRAILSPAAQNNYFWTGTAYRGKIKTPVEFINSSLRALNANISGTSLPVYNDRIGMHLFDHDMPDGWSELGFDWMDTGSLLERIKFVQALAENSDGSLVWDSNSLLVAWPSRHRTRSWHTLTNCSFRWSLGGNRALLVKFVSTDQTGNPCHSIPKARFHPSRPGIAQPDALRTAMA
jgi:hypothetical protein